MVAVSSRASDDDVQFTLNHGYRNSWTPTEKVEEMNETQKRTTENYRKGWDRIWWHMQEVVEDRPPGPVGKLNRKRSKRLKSRKKA